MYFDTVFVEKLTLVTGIGAYQWEQGIEQKLLLDLQMYFDCQRAGQTDELQHALDYAQVSKQVLAYVKGKHFQLVERLAEEIAQLILQQFAVDGVQIRLCKPNAIAQAQGVGVCITRMRNHPTNV